MVLDSSDNNMSKVRSGFKQTKKNQRKSLSIVRQVFLSVHGLLGYELPFSIKPIKPASNKTYLQRDVHKRTFSNPYRQQKKRSTIKEIYTKNKVYFFEGLFIIIGFWWFTTLFIKPTLYINKIAITGNVDIAAEDLSNVIREYLEKRSWLGIKHAHMFFLNEQAMEKALKEQFGIYGANFNAHWPSHKLVVNVTEKKPYLIYSYEEADYSIDENGQIIRFLTQQDKELLISEKVPIVYQFNDTNQNIDIHSVFSAAAVRNISILIEELSTYSQFGVHSLRLRTSAQREVVLNDTPPESLLNDNKKTESESSSELEKAAQNIASATTLDERVENLKKALDSIDIQKVEQGKVDNLLKETRTYSPNPDYILYELEVYMNAGWTLKLGDQALKDESDLKNQFKIFATLVRNINIEGEVKEYIDLRFPPRVYYR